MSANSLPTVTEALKYFLTHNSPNSPELGALYHAGMEAQINVMKLNGEPVEGRRNTYEDGETRWWNIRIPKGADKIPEWKDYPLSFSLSKYAHAVGMSGWNWRDRQSEFVGYDFDSIVGHAPGVGIKPEELKAVEQAVADIPWIETRRSTGGNGLHLYIHFKNPPRTETHTEHAALGRAMLGVMAKEAAFDLASSMDVCGNIIWCFRRDILDGKSNGLKLITPATEKFDKIPINWRDNIDVVSRRKRHIRVLGLTGSSKDETGKFEKLAKARKNVPLDDAHKALMEELEDSGFSTIWVADHWLLQTHTIAIKEVYEKHANEGRKLKGFFETLSGGGDPSKPNCFMFPLKQGGWRVFRFGVGAVESPTWDQSPEGWTQCYFNQAPSLSDAAVALGGLEDGDKPGTYIFNTGADALAAVEAMGKTVDVPDTFKTRQTSLTLTKDDRLHIKIAKEKDDDEAGIKAPGWLAKKGHWTRLENVTNSAEKTQTTLYEHDHTMRFLCREKEEIGWATIVNDEWKNLKKDNVRNYIRALGYSGTETENLLGDAVHNAWELTMTPFGAEEPGGRLWNRDAPQWVYQPADIPLDEEPHHPHWDSVLEHSGHELDQALGKNPWAMKNGVFRGGDYLRLWIASALREPLNHLPYLFLWGPQNSGKSILGDAIELLVTKNAVMTANQAALSSGGFNSELATTIFARLEEVNLREAGERTYNRIKDWITSDTFLVHKKGLEPYLVPNYLKFIHTANKQGHSPIFPGDSRITSIYVPALPVDKHGEPTEIPKPMLKDLLRAEAPHFMTTLIRTVLPEMTTRMRIPVVMTESKEMLARTSMNPLEEFMAEKCFEFPGQRIVLEDFYNTFQATLSATDKATWTLKRVRAEITQPYVVGWGHSRNVSIGNMSFSPPPKGLDIRTTPRCFLDDGYLRVTKTE